MFLSSPRKPVTPGDGAAHPTIASPGLHGQISELTDRPFYLCLFDYLALLMTFGRTRRHVCMVLSPWCAIRKHIDKLCKERQEESGFIRITSIVRCFRHFYESHTDLRSPHDYRSWTARKEPGALGGFALRMSACSRIPTSNGTSPSQTAPLPPSL